ncbi:hypothetical protein BGZ54_001481 [Gamsiella multidivaricata]|nr:hypothetical protein BGZ54_001481 [Gamsiella multidivaricata]
MMAHSIAPSVDSDSSPLVVASTTVLSSKLTAAIIQDESESDDPFHVDPLATTTSVPSSDDGLDDDDTEDVASSDESADNGVHNHLQKNHSGHVDESTQIVTESTPNVFATTANDKSNNSNNNTTTEQIAETPDTANSTNAATIATALPVFPEGEVLLATNTAAQPLEKEAAKKPDDVIVEKRQSKGYDQDDEAEPRRSLSRPLSRQELRRKSSFFNSKDIAVSDQRFSASTSTSMRPIADPRFKSRFQNILSQWKARAGSN